MIGFSPVPANRLEISDLFRPDSRLSSARDFRKFALDKNENPDPQLQDFYASILRDVGGSQLGLYPSLSELYEAIAALEGVDAESLALTSGCDGAIRQTFEIFVSPGDVVVITEPTFAMYSVYAKAFGATPVFIRYSRTDEGPYLDLSEVKEMVRSKRPKVLFLPNPDSPTGSTLPVEEVERISDVCAESGTVLFVDEAYFPFAGLTVQPFPVSREHVVVARTFSKAWGLAGLRVGYVIGHPKTVSWYDKIRPMYEIGAFASSFLTHVVSEPSEVWKSVDRLIEGRNFLVDAMRSRSFTVLPSGGNFTHVDFGSAQAAAHASLDKVAHYRADWQDECLTGFTRISSAPLEMMRVVVDAINAGIEDYSTAPGRKS